MKSYFFNVVVVVIWLASGSLFAHESNDPMVESTLQSLQQCYDQVETLQENLYYVPIRVQVGSLLKVVTSYTNILIDLQKTVVNSDKNLKGEKIISEYRMMISPQIAIDMKNKTLDLLEKCHKEVTFFAGYVSSNTENFTVNSQTLLFVAMKTKVILQEISNDNNSDVVYNPNQ